MTLNAIFRGPQQISQVYRGSQLIFQNAPVQFHEIDAEGRLIIRGAMSAVALDDGLYLDCAPAWEEPKVIDGTLYLRQAYSITQNGDILEVR